jgi:hypothetical protein
MNKDELEKLRRELESFGAKYRNAHSPELEYHLTRLTAALTGRALSGYRHISCIRTAPNRWRRSTPCSPRQTRSAG